MIAESGLILTTSRNLGAAPLADFVTTGGIVGQAWVIGRDDDRDVVLLEVVNPSAPYPFMEVSDAPTPGLEAEVARLAFTDAETAVLQKQGSRVLGIQTDLNTGVRYLQFQAGSQVGSEGGALIDTFSLLRGLRMTEAQMIKIGLGRAGDVYAMSSDALASLIIPELQAGLVNILPPDDDTAGTEPGAPPGLPAVYSGTITIGGQAPPANTRVYARLFKAGKEDLWFSQPLDTTGAYVMPIGLTVTGYENATIKFWVDAQKALQSASYVPGAAVAVNFAFP